MQRFTCLMRKIHALTNNEPETTIERMQTHDLFRATSTGEHRIIFFEEGEGGSVQGRRSVGSRSGRSVNNRESMAPAGQTHADLEALEKKMEQDRVGAYTENFRAAIEEQIGALPAGHRLSVRCEEDFRGGNLMGNLSVVLEYTVGDQQPQTITLHPTPPEVAAVVIDNTDANLGYQAIPHEGGRTLLVFTSQGLASRLQAEITSQDDNTLKNWIADMRVAIEAAEKAQAAQDAAGSVEGRRSIENRGSIKPSSRGSRGSRGSRETGPGSIPNRKAN